MMGMSNGCVAMEGRPLVFALNGSRVELPEVDPALTLLSYLRDYTSFHGTKRGCGEGGCGACVVFLSRYNPRNKSIEELTVNSCLTLLCSIDRCAITTTEGLGNQRTGHHAIHQRLSGFHASQCGFCTPGMTMALYGTLRKSISSCSNKSESNRHCNNMLTAVDAERAVAGNLCRCTGYRPILDTCKSFCEEVDLEDLGINQFHEENGLPPYDPTSDPIFPQFLIEEYYARENGSRSSLHENGYTSTILGNGNTMNGGHGEVDRRRAQPRFKYMEDKSTKDGERVWIDPNNLVEVFEAMNMYQGTTEVKLVVGNTAAGYYKDIRPKVFINISKISELLASSVNASGFEVGAAVTISNFIDFLENLGSFESRASKKWELVAVEHEMAIPRVLASHLKKVASHHVRNWGSVGGNLMMAKQYGFESDVVTILLGVGAHVKTISQGGKNFVTEDLKLEDFLAEGALRNGTLLQSIWVPLHYDVSNNSKVLFKTYRAAARPLGNAVAFMNAAFYARVKEEEGGAVRMDEVRLAFGAYGTKHAKRARNVEQLLTKNSLTWETVLEAIRLLKSDVIPRSGTSKAKYRVSVAGSFLFEFLRPLLASGLPAEPIVKYSHGIGSNRPQHNNELLNSGKQAITMTDEYFPVGQPTVKVASQLQASGEAVYVDDIPSPPNCLHAAFVYSKKALARIQNVDVQSALLSPGTVAYVSTGDIPPEGKNVGINVAAIVNEKLFATDLVECIGHPLGVMLADTYVHAKDAADKVTVHYDTESVGPPVLTVEEAMDKNNLFPVHFLMADEIKPVGDVTKGFVEGDLKIENAQVSTNSQKHFYMEPQTVLVVPDEDNCMVVYASTQTPEYVQTTIATALGLPMHNIRVITRRVGGAFGGKVFRTCLIATACAVAAYKLQRPVRTSLDRNTDMLLIGGRSPTKSTFSVAFTKDGNITALKAQVLVEAGYSPDFSVMLPGTMMSCLKKYNWGALDVDFKVCKTNTVPKTAMRGPGEMQGSFLADSILDHVAARLGLDADLVRERNLHDVESLNKFYGKPNLAFDSDSYTLPSIWARLKATAKLEEREHEVSEFNKRSVWRKRGIAMMPFIYSYMNIGKVAMVTIYPDASVVAEVAGVELGQGLYTKVRQAAAYALSKLWPEGRGVDLSKIRIVQSDTISSGNTGVTSSSTTSEGSCAAVQAACEVLVERLKPIYEKMREEAPNGQVQWETLISKARWGIDMKAHVKYRPKTSGYLNYGAAASEVEINVLTGETQVLATDLLFDCGKSLNPAVDIGQVEGAFVQGIGFFMMENVETVDGKLVSDGTWTYKIPTVDTIPRRFHVELHNSPHQHDNILSSKASGEAPLLLAGSVHCAIRKAIQAARIDLAEWDTKERTLTERSDDSFRLDAPATMDKIKELCGFDNVELYVASLVERQRAKFH